MKYIYTLSIVAIMIIALLSLLNTPTDISYIVQQAQLSKKPIPEPKLSSMIFSVGIFAIIILLHGLLYEKRERE